MLNRFNLKNMKEKFNQSLKETKGFVLKNLDNAKKIGENLLNNREEITEKTLNYSKELSKKILDETKEIIIDKPIEAYYESKNYISKKSFEKEQELERQKYNRELKKQEMEKDFHKKTAENLKNINDYIDMQNKLKQNLKTKTAQTAKTHQFLINKYFMGHDKESRECLVPSFPEKYQNYERIIANCLKKMGFLVYEKGIKEGVKDNGIDLIASYESKDRCYLYLIQCKMYTSWRWRLNNEIFYKFCNDCKLYIDTFNQIFMDYNIDEDVDVVKMLITTDRSSINQIEAVKNCFGIYLRVTNEQGEIMRTKEEGGFSYLI